MYKGGRGRLVSVGLGEDVLDGLVDWGVVSEGFIWGEIGMR